MARLAGARQAKLAERKAALAEELKPVHPGESGGQYQPLGPEDVAQIHEATLRILEEVGFADATDHCIECCMSVGAELGDDRRLRFPRSVIEDTLGKAHRNLTLYALDPKHDLGLSGSRVHFSTAGAAVAKKRALLKTYFPDHLSDEVDPLIRERLPIFLSRQAMGRDA